MIDNIKELMIKYITDNYYSPNVEVNITYIDETDSYNVVASIHYNDKSFRGTKRPVSVYTGFTENELYNIPYVCNKIMIFFYECIMYDVIGHGRKI